MCEFSDFGADYFLAIVWLDYVEICGEGVVRGGCTLVGKLDPTWRGKSFVRNCLLNTLGQNAC